MLPSNLPKMGEGRHFKGNAFHTAVSRNQTPLNTHSTHSRHSCRSNSIAGKFFRKASHFLPRLLSDYPLAQSSARIRQHLASVLNTSARNDVMATPQGRTRHSTSYQGTGLLKHPAHHLTATACKLMYCHLTTE